MAAVLFAVAGDEISWGQRILGIETPEDLKQINTQGEITFHNLPAFNNYVTKGYILLGLFGSLGWILSGVANRIYKYSFLFIPPWFAANYYFVGFIYNYYISTGNHFVDAWAEFSELMLYLGIFIFIISRYFKIKNSNHVK